MSAGFVMLDRVRVEQVDFRSASFDRFALTGCTFVECDFRGLVFDERLQQIFASRAQSVFRECRFDGADLRRSGPGQSRFERCTFDGAVIDQWTSLCGEFVECHFAGPITRSKFYGRPHGVLATQLSPRRQQNEFRGNDFSEAEIVETAFVRGIQIAEQRWPDASTHLRLDRIHQRLERSRALVMRWKDFDARQQGLRLLMELSTCYGEQPEVVVRRPDSSPSAADPIHARVWSLVETPL